MSLFKNDPETLDPHDPRVADDLYHAAPPYTEDAQPGQDARREQLADPPAERVKAEPEPDPDVEPEDSPGPLPYVLEGDPPPPKRDPALSLPDDGQAATHSIDGASVILSNDPQRRSWSVFVPSGSSAGIRIALGARAAEDIVSDVTSVPIPAGGSLDGETTAPVAVRSDTPGTAATVCVLTERNAR